jgi:hypothetical protein
MALVNGLFNHKAESLIYLSENSLFILSTSLSKIKMFSYDDGVLDNKVQVALEDTDHWLIIKKGRSQNGGAMSS